MTEKELKLFFDEYNTISILIRNKKIFELTNGFDVYLLKLLKNEFSIHYLQKAYNYYLEIEGLKDVDLPEEFNNIHHNAHLMMSNYLENKNEKVLTEIMDFYVGQTELQMISIIFEEQADFIYEIDEIIRHKEHKNESTPSAESELIDYSDETLVSKVIFLHSIGVIDELRKQKPFNTSINSLASVLSAVTGGKPTSIQPMLNAMLNTNISPKNNPLNSKNTVNIVRKKLSNLGFNVNR